MVFTTVLDALKTLLDAGTYTGLTATFYIFMKQNPSTAPIRKPDGFKTIDTPTLAANKVIGILMPDTACRTVANWQGADLKRFDGTLMLYAVSFNNLADFIEDIMKVGTDLKTSQLRFSEAVITGKVENELFIAEVRWGWEKIVAHG